jgi:hypothetical protein
VRDERLCLAAVVGSRAVSWPSGIVAIEIASDATAAVISAYSSTSA